MLINQASVSCVWRSFACVGLFILFSTIVSAQQGKSTSIVLSPIEESRQKAREIMTIKDADSAKIMAEALINRAQKEKNRIWIAQIYYSLSFRAYTDGKHQESLDMARQAQLYSDILDSVVYVKAPLMEAYMLNRQGKDVNALKIAFEQVRISEKNGWTRLSIDSRACVADIYRNMRQPEKSLPYAEQMMKDARRIRDTTAYIFCLSTLSNLYSDPALKPSKDIPKATRYYEEIVQHSFFPALSLHDQARHYSNMGRLYQMSGQYDLAEKMLESSLKLCRENKFGSIEKHALNELMTLKTSQGKIREAIAIGKRIVDSKEGDASLTLQKNIYERLSDAHVALKNFELAYDYSRKAQVINDSLINIEKAKTTTEMEELYKADKRILEADGKTRLMKQQRNFIITLAIIAFAGMCFFYWWFLQKRKKKAEMLAEQHRQLEKIDALKTRFFANISHELRTPLSLIVGPADQLHHQEASQPLPHERKLIEVIWKNSRKLLNLVNELLDINKMETGHVHVRKSTITLLPFLQQLFQHFSGLASQKKITYNLYTNIPGEVYIETDREKLEKIINNLIGNALKFTTAGESVILRALLSENELVIRVEDTGIGISAADLPYVFDRYYQGIQTTDMAEGGAGIGLSMVEEYANLLQGEVSVKSTPGKMTSFEVRIPVERSLLYTPFTTETDLPASISQPLYAHLKKRQSTLLLVEDQPEMTEYIVSVLSPYYHLVTARNGIEALNQLAEMPAPALIISDVMMPQMDGYQLLEKLKNHPVYCSIPVILLTALASAMHKLKGLNTGVDDYITKPFLARELISRVAQLIQHTLERSETEEPLELIEETAPSSKENTAHPAAPSPADLLWLATLEKIIRENIGKVELDIASLSYQMAVSERQMHRHIKRITGQTPNKYIRGIRLQVAREAMETGRYRTIAELSHLAGFDTPAYFSKLFREAYGRDVHDFL